MKEGSRDELTRRAKHFRFTEMVSSPGIKNISLFPKTKSGLYRIHPVPLRGALAIVTTRGGERWTRRLRLTIVANAYGKGVWS